MDKIKEVREQCEWQLTHHPSKPMREKLMELVDYLEDEKEDIYGSGEYLQDFENQIAEMFDKQSALFMISGTMAQQIALRIHCEKRNTFRVAFHPECHLDMAEHMGYRELHQIRRVPFTAPEGIYNRLVSIEDFRAIKESIGAIVLELPQRHLAQLPSWEELEAISNWAKENDIAIHLDGARIWESQEFYGKSFKEMAQLFDSIYISFYKGLNSLTGAMLIGDNDFIDEAKVWQRRHGGNLKTLFPYVVSAKKAIEQNLEKMPLYLEKARKLAAIFDSVKRIIVTPFPVHTNMFNIIIQGDSSNVQEKVIEMAQKHKIWLFYPRPAFMQGYSQAEITVGENTLERSDDEIKHLVTEFSTLLSEEN